MSDIEHLPVSQYDIAVPTRLRIDRIGVGTIYTALFRLEKLKRSAVRLNALLVEISDENKLGLEPVDADLRPIGWLMTHAMSDGFLNSVERAPTVLPYQNPVTGQRDHTRLLHGILTAYDQGFEIPILSESIELQRELVGAQ